MKNLLALIDFSDVTTSVVTQAGNLAKALGTQVVLVHIQQRQPMVVDLGIASPTIMQAPTDAMVEKDKARLEELCQELKGSGVVSDCQQWPDSSAEQVIARIKEFDPQMVVIGSHHHGALFKLLVGGVGNDLLKHAPCPVVVVPKAGAA